jgi:hypothetical protein
MYGGTLSNAGGGPVFNAAPNNGAFELYGVAIDITGQTVSSECTALVNCTLTGTPSGLGINTLIHNSTLKGIPGIACFNSSTANLTVPLNDTDASKPTVIYGNSLPVVGKGVNQITNSVQPALVAKNTLAGPVSVTGAIDPKFTWKIYNCSIDYPSGTAANVYGVRLNTPFGGSSNLTEIRRCLFNASLRTINYCGRADASLCAADIYECVGKAGTGFFFDGSSPNTTTTNCTTDGSNPNNYEVGAAYACAELKLLDAYGLEGYDYAVTPVDDISLYYGLFPPSFTSVTTSSSSQCTVSYTNLNAGAKDHRIERATDSGFTTNLTTFDVSAVATGAATYTDTTCLPGVTYYYRVRAKNGDALSIPSGSGSVRTNSGRNLLLLGVG